MTNDLMTTSKESLAEEASRWAAQARAIRITDPETCTQAGVLLRSIKTLRAGVAAFWNPHIEAAMETKRRAEAARKALSDERDRTEAPLVEAEGLLKRALLTWEAEQEQTRLARERELQAEAQRQAEAATLAAAAELEREALATGDAAMLAEAHDILAQPIEAPTVFVKPDVPRVDGISYRDNWKAHERVDVKALAAAVGNGSAPVTFLTPNMTALNAFARATKGSVEVAGVRIINDRQIAARG